MKASQSWLQQLQRSVLLRSAILTMIVAMVATAIALTLQYRQMVAFMETELHESINEEMTLLVDEYGQTGSGGLVTMLRTMSASPLFEDVVYLLADQNGHVVTGNLRRWPVGVKTSGWTHLQIAAGDIGGRRSRWIEANAVRLSGGQHLLVGKPADELAAIRKSYFSGMAWALMVTAISGLGLGWLTSRRIFGFISRYAEATRRFQEGDLSARVPLSNRDDEFDQLGQLINTATDMTERTNATLRAASDSLSHDLKTPLTRMRARLELALRRSSAEDARNEPMLECIGDIDNLLAQINAMLQLVRAESVTEAQFQPINLTEIVTDICETFEPVAEARHIDIAYTLLPLRLSGMKPLVAQAIANLLDNAVKYAPDGGSIDVQMQHSNRIVQIIVADNGPGIDEADRAQAMDRFVRLDNSRTTSGSGLGLHYVSTVARVHRGSLTLEDNQPGLRAVLTLPLSEV
jgi:signal transduction histidine kinase